MGIIINLVMELAKPMNLLWKLYQLKKSKYKNLKITLKLTISWIWYIWYIYSFPSKLQLNFLFWRILASKTLFGIKLKLNRKFLKKPLLILILSPIKLKSYWKDGYSRNKFPNLNLFLKNKKIKEKITTMNSNSTSTWGWWESNKRR